MSTDAIVLLKDEHTRIKRAFRDLAGTPGSDPDERRRLTRDVIRQLSAHTYLENEFLYPAVRYALPELTSELLEAHEEHHVADLVCSELWDLAPDDATHAAKASVLSEMVRQHIEEEETLLFPRLRVTLGRRELQRIGQNMLDHRDDAPEQPESMSPVAKAAETLKKVLAAPADDR